MLLFNLLNDHQGWLLTLLSSLMCIIGASIIYVDLSVKIFNPKSTFDIKSNEKLLIYGFSISAGSLIFTALFKLLSKSQLYFEDVKDVSDKIIPELNILIYFMIGIALCSVMNKLIHYFASESIVHCSHGDEESQTHNHTHFNDGNDSKFNYHSHSNDHNNEEQIHDDFINRHEHDHSHQYSHQEHIDIDDNDHQTQVTESTTLLGSQQMTTTIKTSSCTKTQPIIISSIFDFLQRFKSTRDSTCIDDIPCNEISCISSEDFQQKISNDISNLEFYRQLNKSTSKSSIIAYTQPSNVETATTSQNNQNSYFPSIRTTPSNLRLITESDLNAHYSHKDDHHHRINTPISKLLSIGLQTCFALTLHKVPEGFITYATSKADPKMGISIFLSLALHNIIEGFSMVLPLYLALNSRLKAFMITCFLGGLSQPIGALFAFLILKGREIDSKDSDYIFGVLIAITSGFLFIISLQLFASAINFGGSTNKIIGWSLLGVFIIQFSSVLTSYNS